MSLPSSLVAVLTLLMGTAAPAQPHASRPREEKRVILLKGIEAPTVQPLRVTPKVVTLVLFDMPVLRESVDTEALKPFFTRLEVNESSLVLKPAVALSPGAQPRLKVRFVGGGEPRGMEFELATDPDVVDTQVEVLREEPEEARLRAALTALQGQCAATEAGLAPLRARCALAGLAGLFVSGEMDPEKGVQVHFPTRQPATAQGVMEE